MYDGLWSDGGSGFLDGAGTSMNHAYWVLLYTTESPNLLSGVFDLKYIGSLGNSDVEKKNVEFFNFLQNGSGTRPTGRPGDLVA